MSGIASTELERKAKTKIKNRFKMREEERKENKCEKTKETNNKIIEARERKSGVKITRIKYVE